MIRTYQISSTYSLKSAVKTVVIPSVPARGGVPEGYTMDDISKDIVKANAHDDEHSINDNYERRDLRCVSAEDPMGTVALISVCACPCGQPLDFVRAAKVNLPAKDHPPGRRTRAIQTNEFLSYARQSDCF